MDKKRNILICPLEWGLGHAARMIPLARKLQELGNNVIIGTGDDHIALFRAELTGLSYINFSGFKPGYSKHFPQYLILLFKTPLFLFYIIKEHIKLQQIIKDHEIDIVVSDNRPGLWSKNATTVYITHMPVIPFPRPFKFLEFIGILLHRSVIKRYSLCFIPDLPGELNISGRLSHGVKLPGNVRYTGILSRFIYVASKDFNSTNFRHNTIILSGPEPQRRMLKEMVSGILKDKEFPIVILEGKPGKKEEPVQSDKILSYSHLVSKQMEEMITGSDLIICRSGYTTIMDLISLNRTALLIPTPGQTEQEYLAKNLAEKGWFLSIPQNKIKFGLPFPDSKIKWSSEIISQSKILLDNAIRELLEKHHK